MNKPVENSRPMCYDSCMDMTVTDLELRRKRRAEGLALHAIEGVPFTPDECAFLEELDRAGLSDAERVAAIRKRFSGEQTIAAE